MNIHESTLLKYDECPVKCLTLDCYACLYIMANYLPSYGIVKGRRLCKYTCSYHNVMRIIKYNNLKMGLVMSPPEHEPCV